MSALQAGQVYRQPDDRLVEIVEVSAPPPLGFAPRSAGLYLVQLLFPEAYADYEDTRPLPEGFEPPTDEEDTAPATLKAVQS